MIGNIQILIDDIFSIIVPLLILGSFVIGIYLIYLLIKFLRLYLNKNKLNEEKQIIIRSLGENIRRYRTEKQMTQEFVAESLGVSRQSVSKWETGVSEPSTSNLIALASLLDIEITDLINH